MGPASRSPTSPTVGQLAGSEAGSPQSTQSASNGTIYATADAARVGGGLYSHLLDAAITLATDPASVVAATGAQLLRVAGVELIETDIPPGGGLISFEWTHFRISKALPASLKHALTSCFIAGKQT